MSISSSKTMITPTINYLAVFVAAVATMVLGSLWYSPMLFGKIFMKECKMSEKDKKNGMKGMTSNYIIMFGTALVTAYILAHFVDYVEATSVSAALMLDRKSTRLNSSHSDRSRMPSSA